MVLLGITGGVGMGKSVAQSLLSERGARVLDTDAIARRLAAPGQPALTEIRAAFGPDVFDADGSLNRDALAAVVFADSRARTRLESILHPRIRDQWVAEVDTWRQAGVRVGAVVIPLLFETKSESLLDVTVCVACTPETQLERLRERGWTDEQSRQRLAAQWPIERKMSLSDHVIWTEGTIASHAAQWDRLLDSIRT